MTKQQGWLFHRRPRPQAGRKRVRARRWTLGLTSALAAVTLVAAGCGSASTGSQKTGATQSSPGKPKPGGTLTVGITTAWHPVDPLQLNTTSDLDIGLAVFAPLLSLNPGGSLGPDLATSYKVEDGNKKIVLQLRKGVTFQDGTPFNSAAVVFNLKRLANPKNSCDCLTTMKNMSSVVANGPYAVTITLAQPDASFASDLAGTMGMMVSPTAVRKEGANFGNHPVGAGPFAYQGQVSGTSISFVKWNGYWDRPKPYLAGVTFKVLTSTDTMLSSLQSGVIEVDSDLDPTQISQAQSSGLNVVSLGALGTTWVAFQMKKAPFNNILARKAVTYATNPQLIDDAVAGGKDAVVESPWPPQSWAYPGASVSDYPSYNLAKAKQLVSQLGGLSFTLQVENSPALVDEAQALQSQWAKAGIKVKIAEDSVLALEENALKGNYQATWWRWQGTYDPDGNVFGFYECGGVSNFAQYCDRAVDTLIAKERASNSQSQRKVIFNKMAALMAKDVAYDALMAADFWLAETKQVHGIPALANSWLDLTGAWLG